MSNKFDFSVARQLTQGIAGAAMTMQTLNHDLNLKFKTLGEDFKDSGYDSYSTDMAAANAAIEEVITQLAEVGKAVKEYSDKLQNV